MVKWRYLVKRGNSAGSNVLVQFGGCEDKVYSFFPSLMCIRNVF